MPKIQTHLHLGIIYLNQFAIKNENAFLLGCSYPDNWYLDEADALKRHYKNENTSPCDLNSFLQKHDLKDDFNFGYYFHLWLDNEINTVETDGISMYDCLLSDHDVIYSYIQSLHGDNELQNQALKNIQYALNQPLPLYLVPTDKVNKYKKILNLLITKFVLHLKEIGV